ncbi:hypothetical protein JOC93_003361 [Priestia taiwanensis]|nr:hypothetical protein [Priestia taiwanensis]
MYHFMQALSFLGVGLTYSEHKQSNDDNVGELEESEEASWRVRIFLFMYSVYVA